MISWRDYLTTTDQESLSDHGSQTKRKPTVEMKEFYGEEIVKKLTLKSLEFGDCMLRIVDTSCLEQMVLNDKELQKLLDTSHVLQAVCSHSDLVSGSYEGGLKIWECAFDLTEFLSTKLQGLSLGIKDKSVLELGCGAGLPALFCLKSGAKQVHFQDYNEEVLKLLTCVNVRLSTENTDLEERCRYFAGDWSSFSDLSDREKLKYDIILTAETIYNEENYSKLHALFDAVLKENGFILLAAKSYYFGVGGSIEGFLEYVGSMGMFSSETVHTVAKGVPRYILLLKRMEKNHQEEVPASGPEDNQTDSSVTTSSNIT
ncbi:histidine protein methyltransferase 1 homolog isoform X2 [Aplysia californica]|uniref:protein-histidine N-methyltransferase n=1 Tax=Aplysia californica TaxID=6500 RepID=A0ABM1VZD8_APLCA|nr:histidine protein methyltransferase 1 homolog isoform X2 [Aplysia californica]